MKAQAIRRTLWLVDGLLVAALLGAGAWYVMKVRPASAEGTKPTAWAAATYDKYHNENIERVDPYPIKSLAELDAIVSSDLRDTKVRDSATIVGVFVGPPPPEPKPPEAAKVVQGPQDLEALARPTMVMYNPGGAGNQPTSVMFEFKDGKSPHGVFEVGEFVKAGKNEPDRFKMTALLPNPESPKWKIVFDVYDDPKKDPVKKDQVFAFEIAPKPGKTIIKTSSPAGTLADGVGGKPTAAAGTGPNPNPGAAPTPSEVSVVGTSSRLTVTKAGNNVHVEFLDDDAYGKFRSSDPDKLLEAVKTTEVKDEKGNVRGLQVDNIDAGSLASEFNVQRGDVLLSINGQVVHSRADAMNIAKSLPKDTKSVNVVIERNGRQIVYDIDPRDPKLRGAGSKIKFNK
jgi:hypothetical protein